MIRVNDKFLNYFSAIRAEGDGSPYRPRYDRDNSEEMGGMRQRRPSTEGLGLQFEQFGQAWPGRRDSTAGHAEDWPMRKAHH